MTTEKIYLQKSWPYKLAIMCLYAEGIEGITHPIPGTVLINTPALCTNLNIPSDRLRLYLQEMERLDIIEQLTIARGIITFVMVQPPNLMKIRLDK